MPMVPMPAAGGSALGRYLRFLVLERERDKEIELEREILPQKTLRVLLDRELYYSMKDDVIDFSISLN